MGQQNAADFTVTVHCVEMCLVQVLYVMHRQMHQGYYIIDGLRQCDVGYVLLNVVVVRARGNMRFRGCHLGIHIKHHPAIQSIQADLVLIE